MARPRSARIAAYFIMPYSGVSDDTLPDAVKELPEADRKQWVAAFNGAFTYCENEDKGNCEEYAFKVAWAAIKKEDQMPATRMTQFRDNDYPPGQLCPYPDCCHDLAIPKNGWYKCGACDRVFYAGDTDSDFEDYVCYREDKAPDGTPEKPEEIPVAKDLGASWATPKEEDEEEDSSEKKESRMKISLRTFVSSLLNRSGSQAPASARAKSLDEAFYDLMDQVWKLDEYAWMNGAFLDEGDMFAVISSSGKLYRAEITTVNDSFQISPRDSWIEVKLDFPAVSGSETTAPAQQLSRTMVKRQDDGRYRWFSISCSAVLNRSGEIDSRALFDSFIKHAEETGEYPIRQFFHAGEKFRIGQADFLARDDYLLLTSGLYDDTVIGRAEVTARQKDPGYWGDSIGFYPTKEPEKIRVTGGVEILAYDEGILVEISTLPEAMAASWYTATPTIQEVDRMLTQKQKEELVKLMGVPVEEVDKWLEANAATRNREIEDSGKVTRQVGQPALDPETQPEPETAPTGQPETQPEAFVFDDATFTALVSRVGDGLDERIRSAVSEAVQGLNLSGQIEDLKTAINGMAGEIDKRLKPLENGEEEKRKIWLQDAPKVTLRQTTRPRNPEGEGAPDGEPESMADQAAAVLANVPHWARE